MVDGAGEQERHGTAHPAGGEIDVDVLIVGGGVLAHYLAGELADEYSLCVLVDPSVRPESLDTEGLLSAGYDGTDVGRIQPARRSAGFWRLWAESNGLAHRDGTVFLLAPDEVVARTRFWQDAALGITPLEALPEPLVGGALAGREAFEAVHDVVIDPGVLLSGLRERLSGCWLVGTITDVVLSSDEAIDAVEVELPAEDDQQHELVAIVPRVTVFASDWANADLLARVAARTRDAHLRRERAQTARTCQAVRRQVQVLVRGALPALSAAFDGMRIVSHDLGGTGGDGPDGERVWIITPPIDDALTVEGPDDARFDPPVPEGVVASAVGAVLDAAPGVAKMADELSWAARVRRRTEHPMMATADVSTIGQPSPAKIETLGMDAFLAIWSGHLPYALVVGDVVAERLREALGPSSGPPGAVAGLVDDPGRAVAWFASDAVAWSSFGDFCAAHGVERR